MKAISTLLVCATFGLWSFGYGGDIPGFFRRYRERLDNRDDIPRHSGLPDRDVARLRVQYSEK